MRLCASSYTEFIHRQEGVIMAWYEDAVFYHMYPIGMTGAPRENREEGWCTGLKETGQMDSPCGRYGMYSYLYRTAV